MKKSILILALSLSVLSCSNDDDGKSCQEKKDEINDYYDAKVEYVMTHPGPSGVDYGQIALLNEERSKKLSEACN